MPNRRLLGAGLNSWVAGGCGGEPTIRDAASEATGDGGAEGAGEGGGTGAWGWAGEVGTFGLESIAKCRGNKKQFYDMWIDLNDQFSHSRGST